jgi:hypothetical protein
VAANRAETVDVRIFSVKPHQNAVIRFLGPIRGTLSHWVGKHAEHCQGPDDCPRAVHCKREIWKGYASAQLWAVNEKHWLPIVLEVTGNLEEQLRGREVRGECYLLSRAPDKGKVGAVSAVFVETFATVPAAFAIDAVLMRAFRVSKLFLDVPNSLPDRVRIAPTPGDAPTLPEVLAPTAPVVDEKAAARFREELAKMRGGYVPSPNGKGH